MSLLVVVRVLPYYVAFIVVFVTVFIMDRQVLKTVDYSLILTLSLIHISMVERTAVNRDVVGSSPTRGVLVHRQMSVNFFGSFFVWASTPFATSMTMTALSTAMSVR